MSSQNSVSQHSLKAMYILAKKSFLEIAASASTILAPMLVPLLSTYFERVYSFLSSTSSLYRLMMSMAKALLLYSTVFSFSIYSLTPHFSLLTPHCLHHFLMPEIDIKRHGDDGHESHDAPEGPSLLLEG